MTWSSVDWTATEAVVGRIQNRIFRAAKTKRQRLEPDAEQSARPVLRGALDSNVEAPTRRSLTVWFTEEAIAAWHAEPRTTPGGQPHLYGAFDVKLCFQALHRYRAPSFSRVVVSSCP